MAGVRIVARDRADRLGEGLLWSQRDGAVYWVDILGQRVNRLTLGDDAVASWPVPEMIGWLIERRDAPGFITGLHSGFAELTLDPLAIAPIADPEPHLPDNRMNDAIADAQERIWAGTMPVGCDVPTGALYRLETDRRITPIERDYTIPNGPAISPDGAWFYHTDSALGTIFRFALGPDGELRDRTPFVTFESGWGSPDGMTVDGDGGLWVAHWGGACVSRFTPSGHRARTIELPASQITNCTFAGDALDRMFVTSAADGVNEEHGGALFEVETGCTGLAPHRYAG